MKFNELKNKLKERFLVSVSAGVLAFSLVITGVTCSVYAAKGTKEEDKKPTEFAEVDTDEIVDDLFDGEFVEKEIDKEETVYIIADETGAATNTIVSDHLYNRDHAATIEDKSNLSDIENVKGDEDYTESNGKLVWNAEGNDIYYHGKSSKELPVTTSIKYFLDGKQVTASELAGKSGKVTIRYDYTNNTSYTETVHGKDVTVSVPFTAISALVLNDNFKNVEVTNGKLMETSAGNVVVGYAVPGLADSLKLSKKNFKNFNLPEYFEMTADVENFSLDIAMTVVVNAGSYISSGEVGLDSLDEIVDTLSDACEQLDNGSTDLANGMKDLYDGLKKYTDGVDQLNTGLSTLNKKTGTLVEGVNALGDGVNQLVDSIAAMPATVKAGINTSLNELNTSGFATAVYATGYNKDTNNKITVDNISNITTYVAGHEAQIEIAILTSKLATTSTSPYYGNATAAQAAATAVVTDPTNASYAALLPYYNAVVSGYETALAGCYKGLGAAGVYAEIAQSIPTSDLAKLKAGANTLVDSMPALTKGISDLNKGSKTLASKNSELLDGANKLVDGSATLSDALTTLNKDGVQKIVDAYNGDVKELVDRIQVVLNAAENYGIFSETAEGKNGSVKFVTKVKPITAE